MYLKVYSANKLFDFDFIYLFIFALHMTETVPFEELPHT